MPRPFFSEISLSLAGLLGVLLTALVAANGCGQPTASQTDESAGIEEEHSDVATPAETAGDSRTAVAEEAGRTLSAAELLDITDFSRFETRQLFDAVSTLERYPTPEETPEAERAHVRRVREHILRISDELLSRDLEPRLRYGAILARFESHSEMVNADLPDAEEGLQALSERYLDDPHEDVVRVAREHLLMLATLRLAEGRTEGTADVPELLGDYLAAARRGSRGLGQVELMMARQVAMVLEGIEQFDPARRAYETLAAAFGEAEDSPFREPALHMAEAGLKRLGLVGEPLDLSGRLITGEHLDGDEYLGKVVLVDFWASWCGPCVREFPHLIAHYEKYREQGFEIVGISLDEEQGAAERAISLFELPWPVLYSERTEEQGWEHPLAVKCGVTSLPAMFLLDREGRVVSLGARSDRLESLLEEMLSDR